MTRRRLSLNAHSRTKLSTIKHNVSYAANVSFDSESENKDADTICMAP